MIITEGRDCLVHDFHTHSVQSGCGMHTVDEILTYAAQKGVESVNICDHGSAAGRKMNFGVIADPRRTPMEVEIDLGGPMRFPKVRLLAGIEANILDDGSTDIPDKATVAPNFQFHLVSAGFHSYAKELKAAKDPERNFKALVKFVGDNPYLDILTHPCIATFPLPTEKLIALAKDYDFALEVNNTNLAVNKTNMGLLKEMILLALREGVTLLCNSDGHTWYELFECGLVRAFVEGEMGLKMKEVFPLNFGPWEDVRSWKGRND